MQTARTGPVATIWDERYCTGAASTNSTTKQAEVVREAAALGLLDQRTWPFSSTVTRAGIEKVHDAAYVRAVRALLDTAAVRPSPSSISTRTMETGPGNWPARMSGS
jgi:hypothetical protein